MKMMGSIGLCFLCFTNFYDLESSSITIMMGASNINWIISKHELLFDNVTLMAGENDSKGLNCLEIMIIESYAIQAIFCFFLWLVES